MKDLRAGLGGKSRFRMRQKSQKPRLCAFAGRSVIRAMGATGPSAT